MKRKVRKPGRRSFFGRLLANRQFLPKRFSLFKKKNKRPNKQEILRDA